METSVKKLNYDRIIDELELDLQARMTYLYGQGVSVLDPDHIIDEAAIGDLFSGLIERLGINWNHDAAAYFWRSFSAAAAEKNDIIWSWFMTQPDVSGRLLLKQIQ